MKCNWSVTSPVIQEKDKEETQMTEWVIMNYWKQKLDESNVRNKMPIQWDRIEKWLFYTNSTNPQSDEQNQRAYFG